MDRTMTRCLASFVAVSLLSVSSSVAANTEPTGYDTRSIGMGITGVAFLKRPAAVALNPANLAGIDRGGASLAFTPLLVSQRAPVSGPPPLEGERAPLAFGPLASAFGALRVHDRVVLGAGVYFEQGYGSTFENVSMLDGQPVSALTDGALESADLSVLFFQAEAALAAGVEIARGLSIGVALRLPFVRQDADLLQSLPIGDDYVRVENSFSGVAWPWDPYPAVKLGITWDATEQMAFALVYRSRAEVPMSGRAAIHSNAIAQIADPESDADVLRVPASSSWVTPHVLHFGAAFRTENNRWLFPIEYRVQFHEGANQAQEITATVPIAGSDTEVSLDANLYWKNVHSVRLGAEYWFPRDVALRAGGNLANSATSPRGAQFFTPPPGFNGAFFVGAGKRFGEVSIDFATGVAGGRSSVEHHPAECGPAANVKTGCGGDYAVATYWLSLQAIWQPGRKRDERPEDERMRVP
jgi:long-subunit fatty acid transport protein